MRINERCGSRSIDNDCKVVFLYIHFVTVFFFILVDRPYWKQKWYRRSRKSCHVNYTIDESGFLCEECRLIMTQGWKKFVRCLMPYEFIDNVFFIVRRHEHDPLIFQTSWIRSMFFMIFYLRPTVSTVIIFFPFLSPLSLREIDTRDADKTDWKMSSVFQSFSYVVLFIV